MEGKTQQAPATSGMSEGSARNWRQRLLASGKKDRRRWRTKPDLFDHFLSLEYLVLPLTKEYLAFVWPANGKSKEGVVMRTVATIQKDQRENQTPQTHSLCEPEFSVLCVDRGLEVARLVHPSETTS